MPPPPEGIIEADETFLGGKSRNGGGPQGKTVVLGAVERGGQVRLKHTGDRKAHKIRQFIRENVSGDADALYTDKLAAYKFAAKSAGVEHEAINKSEGEWVHGQVHTNTIEGVWSLLDRSIIGAYHKISVKHLPAYLDEQEWRYNNRKNDFLFRDTLIRLVEADPMEYKELTAA